MAYSVLMEEERRFFTHVDFMDYVSLNFSDKNVVVLEGDLRIDSAVSSSLFHNDRNAAKRLLR